MKRHIIRNKVRAELDAQRMVNYYTHSVNDFIINLYTWQTVPPPEPAVLELCLL